MVMSTGLGWQHKEALTGQRWENLSFSNDSNFNGLKFIKINLNPLVYYNNDSWSFSEDGKEPVYYLEN